MQGDFFSAKDHIVIYGAGSTGRRVLDFLKRRGWKADFFIDREANGPLNGIPVKKPDDPQLDFNAIVIVALFNHQDNIPAVINSLKQSGFKKIIPYTELFVHFNKEFPVHYWLGPLEIYQADKDKIKQALALFEDKNSRKLFSAFLDFRLSGNPFCMPDADKENIYFPSDIPMQRPDRFVDCGAFTGDTLFSAKKIFGILESCRAFEPDPDNFKKLNEANEASPFARDAVFYPYAVWSAKKQLSFDKSGSLSGSIKESGSQKVDAVTLDECLNGYNPSLIKMDTEGSELEALQGARRMISSGKPGLAVSVYHKPEHLWEIPLLIKEICPDYSFYLRSHGENGYDTVLYARNPKA